MGGGRPKKPIDFKTLENLCAIQCTGEEIASVLGVDYDTLCRRIKSTLKMNFAEYYAQKSGFGKVSLRRRQFALAETNVAMAIFLGKNYLGQSDRQDIKMESNNSNIQILATLLNNPVPNRSISDLDTDDN